MGKLSWGRKLATLAVAGWCTAAGIAGCDSEGEGPAICEEAYAKLRGCALLSEGEERCEPFDDRRYGPCVIECLRPAPCEEIQAQFCEDADNTYARCLDRCQAVFAFFECGDGTSIEIEDVCDDTEDCANGADERDCEPVEPTFDCGNGELVYPEDQCDGAEDCSNGGDEAGCPPIAMTVCPGGPP